MERERCDLRFIQDRPRLSGAGAHRRLAKLFDEQPSLDNNGEPSAQRLMKVFWLCWRDDS